MLVGRHSSEVLFSSSALIVVNIFPLDLALNQPATQASVYGVSGASLAVDGNKNRDYSQGSCIHTQPQKDPWWRVDLGASLPIAEVFIVNRLCTCANHMNAFEIRIGKAIFTLLFKTHKLSRKKRNSLEVSNAIQACHTHMKHVRNFVKFSLK